MRLGAVGRWSVAAAAAVGVSLALGAGSQIPYDAEAVDHAVIRLAWRVRGVRVEECRRLSHAEQERLPMHMRRNEICEGRMLPYRLVVTVDGRQLIDEEVRAAGAREDRPLYVFREIPVAAGAHDLAIRFTLAGEPAPGSDLPTPERLHLDQRIELGSRAIALITYESDTRRLVVRGSGP